MTTVPLVVRGEEIGNNIDNVEKPEVIQTLARNLQVTAADWLQATPDGCKLLIAFYLANSYSLRS